MLIPSCETIEELGKIYNTIPVCKEIYADAITPIALLKKLSEKSRKFYLLESVEGGEKWGRYSFLGFDPIMRVRAMDGRVTVEKNGAETVYDSRNPYDVLREILSEYKAPVIKGLPPFTGGFVGYFAYAMIGYAEPALKIKKGNFSDMDVMLFDRIIAYDHLKQKISIVVNMNTDRIMENYGKACGELEAVAAMIREPNRNEGHAKTLKPPKPEFTCNVTKEEYCRSVEKIKEHITKGDVFQLVYSRRFKSPYEGSLLSAYRVLRTTNPSPYMVYMNFDGDEIISTSPETLVKLDGGRLYTFPVAGSRPRGETEQEDERLRIELMADEKELAEHDMLVDLGRNDLGKISEFGTVEVTAYQMIHKYSRIMHICSQVEGDIRENCDGLSAVEAVLPAGTLSGAPKIRACEIIEEMEPEPRGIYGGALGYIDFTGSLDTCIAIRMAAKKGGFVYVQAGGGIVADSVPEKEYEESANKAAAVINAIERAGEVDA